MYNIKGPSKMVAKTTTRRGISQNIDNYRDSNRNNKIIDNEINNERPNVPKPIFHKKSSPNCPRHKIMSPHHEELVNFICQSWNTVCSELDQENVDSDESSSLSPPSEQAVCYYEDEPNECLQDFKAFDLESWWGQRLYAYVTSTTDKENNNNNNNSI